MFKFKAFDLMVALYIFGIMVAELMGAKIFPLVHFSWLHLNASAAIFVLPLMFSATDVVAEVYGRERARSLVRIGLVVVVLQIVTAWLFTSLPPSARYSHTEPAYDTIFGTSIRFGIASVAAFAVAEFMDVAVFTKLRERMGNQALWLRNNASNFVSQFVDSAVFYVIAFYAFNQTFAENWAFIAGLLIPYWAIRCVFSLAGTPLVYAGVGWLRKTRTA